MRFRTIFLTTAMCFTMAFQVMAEEQEIDFIKAKEGLLIIKEFNGNPDEFGILKKFKLKLPEYKRGVYFQGGWWPKGGNRVYSRVIRPQKNGTIDILEVHDECVEGGVFAIFELVNGEYLAVLPLAGSQIYSWFNVEGGKIQQRKNRQAPTGKYECVGGTLELKFGHHGTAAVSGDFQICAWSRSKGLYEAVAKVWKKAADPKLAQGRFKLREEKEFPELFKYLGWCSWDCIGMDCNNDLMVKALKGLHESPVPIRWALMDDGHYNRKSLLNDSEKFPQSYANLMKYRSEEKLKWIGIWYAMFGNFGGTPQNPSWDAIKEHYRVVGRRMVPKTNVASGRAYFRYLMREAKKHGFDFIKTDFQSFNMKFFGARWPRWDKKQANSCANPYAAAMISQQAFHEVMDKDYKGLINCNWHNAPSIFGSFNSVVGRCSEDNKGGEQDAISHTFHSFTATPWLGQVAWGDHDMFHSGDKSSKAAKFNVIAKAVSGSAVYLSEYAEKIKVEYVKGLCFEDGLLLRPLAPATALPEDLFYQLYQDRLYAAIAPLPNKCATIVVYNTNRRGPQAKRTFTRTFTAADYADSSAMIQPYPGKWKTPEEGLLVYDWYNKTARVLGSGYDVSLKSFDYRILQFCPIKHGWAVIGRSDKYLSASGVKSLKAEPDKLVVELHRSGPLTIWSKRGAPKADGFSFKDAGRGLFTADIPVSYKPIQLVISR